MCFQRIFIPYMINAYKAFVIIYIAINLWLNILLNPSYMILPKAVIDIKYNKKYRSQLKRVQAKIKHKVVLHWGQRKSVCVCVC